MRDGGNRPGLVLHRSAQSHQSRLSEKKTTHLSNKSYRRPFLLTHGCQPVLQQHKMLLAWHAFQKFRHYLCTNTEPFIWEEIFKMFLKSAIYFFLTKKIASNRLVSTSTFSESFQTMIKCVIVQFRVRVIFAIFCCYYMTRVRPDKCLDKLVSQLTQRLTLLSYL